MTAHVRIDEQLCSGHGRCYVVAPNLFVDDESGFGRVRGQGVVPDELLSEAAAARVACPERAIAVVVD